MVPLQIVTVVAGLIVLVVKQFWPEFPFSNEQVVAAIVALLGLFGVIVQLRARIRGILGAGEWWKSKALWIAVAGIANIVLLSYVPDFPVAQFDLAALLFWVLAQFGINPELRAQRLIK